MNLNISIISGRLTRKPELRAMPGGTQVANFSIATNRVWTDKDGNKQDSADFHNIVVFGKNADACASFLTKGQLCLVVGRLQTRSWEKDDGSKAYKTEIVANTVQFGPRMSQDGVDDESPDDINQDAAKGQNKAAKAAPAHHKGIDEPIKYPEEEINPDEIHF